ncbi:MAG TPA: type IV pilus secretin PilQ [Deltaproteobacteria bacterium]|nr:type IV pilus secretin PilQ [Deltaproteobacteria bacterium]
MGIRMIMLKISMQKMRVGLIIVALTVMAMSVGCAGKQETKKDPFLEKWMLMAQEKKGKSPVAHIRKIELPPEPGVRPGEKSEREKALPQTSISLKMRNADVKTVLRSLARAADQNILIKNDLQGRVSVDFDKVPWDQAFLSILRSQALTYIREGNIIRIADMNDIKNDLEMRVIEAQKREKAPLMSMVVPINFADPKALADNVTGFLKKDEKGQVYGSVKVSEHTNALIIQASRDDLKEIVAMIEEIDQPTPQILIEATIVETTKNTARSLGIQWGGMYGNTAGGKNYIITPGGSGGTVGTNPVTSGGYSPTYGSSGISGHGYGINFPGSAELMSSAGGAGSLGLMFGTLGGNILDMQLNALQEDGKLNILSRPSITTLDNQTAYTENGERVPYVSVDKDGNREVKFEDVVLRLEITPHVIDGQNIKMGINVKKNEVNESKSVEGNPRIYKKETDTTLIVKDSETIVISGLSKQKNQEAVSGIPGMKDIPVLGWLFKSNYKAEDMEEVLIFITPHVLKSDASH